MIRAPDGFTVEHDASRGDLYLRPVGKDRTDQAATPAAKLVTLFLGTEKGFTYRLTLTVAERDSAQVLIRNADALAAVTPKGVLNNDPYRGTLVALIRPVARREPLPGYVIEAAATAHADTIPTIETWRGPRFIARVLQAPAGTPPDAARLASLSGAGIAAAWVSAEASGPTGGRLAVVVHGSRVAGAAPKGDWQ